MQEPTGCFSIGFRVETPHEEPFLGVVLRLEPDDAACACTSSSYKKYKHMGMAPANVTAKCEHMRMPPAFDTCLDLCMP